jgi:hypothetical protein
LVLIKFFVPLANVLRFIGVIKGLSVGEHLMIPLEHSHVRRPHNTR